MSPLQEGTHDPGTPPQVQVLPEVYFAPTRVTATTSATARLPAADEPARL
jgi:hypothetical protein